VNGCSLFGMRAYEFNAHDNMQAYQSLLRLENSARGFSNCETLTVSVSG